jgi:predicted RecA/RadA family phage recombinase
MKNWTSPNDPNPVKFLAGSAYTSGQALLLGAMFGIVGASVASGAYGVLHRVGIVTLTKVTTDAPSQGAKLYWDNSALKVTTTSSANTFIGYAQYAQINGDTTVSVVLTPGGV